MNGYPNMGYVQPNRPQPRNTQPVTAEMSKMVLQNSDELSVKISPTEKIKNMCTHKFPGTGQSALLMDQSSDKVFCRVCGESFHLITDVTSEIFSATEKMIDVLQSAKVLYLDIPEEFAKEYFQILTLLGRTPQLFEKACKNFAQYDQWSSSPMGVNGGVNSFQQVGAIIGGFNLGGIPMGGYPGYGMYQQPPVNMYGAPQGPAGYPPQYPPQNGPVVQNQQAAGYPPQGGYPYPPQPQPGYGYPPYPAADGTNPFMQTAPVAPPAGQAAVAPPPPQAPNPGAIPTDPNGEVSQTKTFSV